MADNPYIPESPSPKKSSISDFLTADLIAIVACGCNREYVLAENWNNSIFGMAERELVRRMKDE